ncbi:MAG: radical SAM protein [Lachnospiraceae bacterium]|nr:radical SAM protein [Lachnospiraceae bacterium]
MSTGIGWNLERQSVAFAVDRIMHHLRNKENKRDAYVKLAGIADTFSLAELSGDTMQRVKEVLQDEDNRWVRLADKMIDETDPNVLKMTLLNLGYESMLNGTKTIRKNREIYHCNIPWLILFDPTQACNMHCTGCWSGTYGHKSALTFEEMDKIVMQGKALGAHLYMMTGGEPLVRKNDILKLMEKHQDCQFAAYTNSTLVDQDLCDRMKQLGNLILLLSIEGTPETNDSRRGDGHDEAVMKAMDLLHKNGLIFGTSICYTSQNIEAVTSEAFLRMLSDKGAHFGFYFHYMPVGKNAVPELMPTPEQRREIIRKIRWVRSRECDIPFFPMDFQNDGEYVGGCIAGGRNYFHINANGDAEPCVFIHFSDTNIRENSILEMLQSPLFMAYHEGQPFNQNHLRPCPMLENPEKLREIVAKSGAHQTNFEAPEEVDELCDKCEPYAESWEPEAEELWEKKPHKKPAYTNYAAVK